MNLLRRAAVPVTSLALALCGTLLAGCGGGGGGSSPVSAGTVGAANPGQVRIMLADAPVPGLTAVNVTFTKVEALYDGEADSKNRTDDDLTPPTAPDTAPDANDQWVTLSAEAHTVNLLAYANKPANSLFSLVSVNVPSGHYKKFRFTLGGVQLVINGLTLIPTVQNNTIVVDTECFVSPHENETLVLDFDAGQSLTVAGSAYSFDPRLRLMQQDHAGSVTGTVQFQALTLAKGFGARVELVDAAGQVVAQTEVEFEVDTPQGSRQLSFAMHAIPTGTFSLRVTGGDDFEGVTNSVAPVNVAAGQTMAVGTVSLYR